MSDWVLSLPFALASLLVAVHVGACILALGVLPGNRKPSTAMAWLILILAVPFFGFLAFLLFGSTTVGRKRRALQDEVNERDDGGRPAASDHGRWPGVGREETVRGFDRLNRDLGVLPLASATPSS